MSDPETNEEPQQVQNLPAVQDRPQRVPILAGGPVRAIVPQDFDGAFRIANVIVRAGMAPKSLDTVEKCMVAIMHGMEVGLTPMNALQTIAVINGKPTIYGDGAIGLVLASGICEGVEERYEGKEGEDSFKAICVAKRKGHKPVIGEFSIADAKTAGLWTKRGRNGEPTPWQTYPKRMLKFRARWALRDAFADVLKGLALREEMEDLARMQEPTSAEHDQSSRRTAPPPPAEGEAKKDDPISSGPSQRRAPPPPVEETIDEALWLEALENAFSAGEDSGDLAEAQNKHMMPMKGKVSEDAWKEADTKLRAHLNRIETAE